MTPQAYAIKALPLIQAMAEGKTIQLKTEKGTWEDRDSPLGHFEFDDVEYRVKPDNPEDEWREALFETFMKWLPQDRLAEVASRFNEIFAQRPPCKWRLSTGESRELWGHINAYVVACLKVEAADVGATELRDALWDRSQTHTALTKWIEMHTAN